MRLSDFDFSVPEDLIAQEPLEPRDAARLLLVEPHQQEDKHFRDLPSLLQPGDLLVVNTTRVIPARLYGWRDSVAVEVTLSRPLSDETWQALARPGKRLKPGQVIRFEGDLSAHIEDKNGAHLTLRFNLGAGALEAALEAQGSMPLPPYIRRARGGRVTDKTAYQSIFAQHKGAVAAPTASLHMTPAVLANLKARGLELAEVTLHVGLGTFAPIQVEDTDQHLMHAEWCRLPAQTATAIAATRKRGGRVIALGTTALRTLEAFQGQAGEGETDLFIQPGYRFQVVDGLVTNFHLPRSTLFMLVSAFMGRERMLGAYAHAVAHGYRFFSYGDASLLLPNKAEHLDPA